VNFRDRAKWPDPDWVGAGLHTLCAGGNVDRVTQTEELSLNDAVTHLLEECRMVLPGVQALFGFQLIAVFSAGFSEQLSMGEQKLHLAALALVAIAAALLMAPAAYHRQTAQRQASVEFLELGSRLVLWSMVPLMAGIGIDFYLISRVILGSVVVSITAAMSLMIVFAGLWFGLPRFFNRTRTRRT
jgi:hypothetical protein